MAEASKLQNFLTEHKLNSKRLLAVSHSLEQHSREDRALKLARRANKKEGAEKKEVAKPKSGRAITERALAAALTGAAPISGPTKSRILRAVNAMLESKKKEKVELKTLF